MSEAFWFLFVACVESKKCTIHLLKCNLGTHQLLSEDNLAFYQLGTLEISFFICICIQIAVRQKQTSSEIADRTVTIDRCMEEEVLAWISVIWISTNIGLCPQRLNRHHTIASL